MILLSIYRDITLAFLFATEQNSNDIIKRKAPNLGVIHLVTVENSRYDVFPSFKCASE